VVTEEELHELLQDCPRLYHMAERDSWPSIRAHGLLSTTALLDRYGMVGPERRSIEAERRPGKVILKTTELGRSVVRDQIPMDDKGLGRCLEDGLLPENWYRLLNSKVFFWLSRTRLLTLLNADAYRSEEHDVLEVDARRLVAVHRDRVWLCPMNSGCTKPMPHPRGLMTFRRISDYPYSMWKRKRRRGERVVELAVDYAVPDIVQFVERVVSMKGDLEVTEIFGRI
jgi:hypothetical protein